MQIKNGFKILASALLLSACSAPEARKTTVAADSTEVDVVDTLSKPLVELKGIDSSMAGYYVGGFIAEKMNDKKSPMYSNRINVSLDSIINGILYGHSVVAGNSRMFSGKISEKTKGLYSAEVKESGDNKYDGVFAFELNSATHELAGKWMANDKALPVSERSYKLNRKIFKYDPSLEIGKFLPSEIFNSRTNSNDEWESVTETAGNFNASTVVLKSSDIDGWFKRDLEVMRNAIYARHGYSFKNRQMRYFFDKEVDWYIPVSVNVSKELTDIEKKNIELIKSHEAYAEKYYDTYGR